MQKFCGEKAKIVEVLLGLCKGQYLLDIDNCSYRWTVEMFEEPVPVEKELDLIKILKDCPRGTKLYSTVYGEVLFKEIKEGNTPLIKCINGRGESILFTGEGKYYNLALPEGECILYPSRGCRDWSKFVVENLLNDKDLVWCWDDNSTCVRTLRFYHAESGHTYSYNGKSDSCITFYDHYEKYEGKWPQWAKEAVEFLED